MAYVNGDILVEVKGVTSGPEIWSNTWAVEGATSLALKEEAVARVHNFYNQIDALLCDTWEAQVATVHDLFANTSQDVFFDDVAGTSAFGPLPQQIAVRVSLSAGVNVRGGPFLTGFASDRVDADGLFDSASQIIVADEAEDLAEELAAEGLGLALHSPTNTALFTVYQVRVGQRFDIIRKRANEILESYQTRLVP